MKASNTSGLITIPALGHDFDLGSLYDSRSDKFCGGSLFEAIPQQERETLDGCKTVLEYSLEETKSHRLDQLELGAELKASFLAGLVQVEGKAEYAKSEKKATDVLRVTLRQKAQLKAEKFDFTKKKYHPNIELMKKSGATHFVGRIVWGCNILVVFETTLTDSSKKEKIAGDFKAYVKQPSFDVSGQAKANIGSDNSDFANNITFKIIGDIPPPTENITTKEGIMKFLHNYQEVLKHINGGKGVPLEYDLIPISFAVSDEIIEKDNIIYKIEESDLRELTKGFDEYELAKEKVSSLLEMISAVSEVADHAIIKEAESKKGALEDEADKYRKQIRSGLISARGENDTKALEEAKIILKKSEILPAIDKFVTEKLNELDKKLILFSNLKRKGAELLPLNKLLQNVMFNMEQDEFYVLFYKDSETANVATSDTVKFFKKLLQNKAENKAFIVVDVSATPELSKERTRTTIEVWKDNKLVNSDYKPDAPAPQFLLLTQTGSINKNYSLGGHSFDKEPSNERHDSEFIKFPKPFTSTPRVAVALAGFNVNCSNAGVRTSVSHIDENGFMLEIYAPAGARVYSVLVSWLATINPKVQIYQDHFNDKTNTLNLGSNSAARTKNVEKSISQHGFSNPKVAVAISGFEASVTDNIRLDIASSVRDKNSVATSLTTWADSITPAISLTTIVVDDDVSNASLVESDIKGSLDANNYENRAENKNFWTGKQSQVLWGGLSYLDFYSGSGFRLHSSYSINQNGGGTLHMETYADTRIHQIKFNMISTPEQQEVVLLDQTTC